MNASPMFTKHFRLGIQRLMTGHLLFTAAMNFHCFCSHLHVEFRQTTESTKSGLLMRYACGLLLPGLGL